LRHPLHEIEHLLAEEVLDLLRVRERVLDGVVEEAGDDAGLVQLEVREEARDFERVDEVGLARLADLPLVDLRGVDVGLLDEIEIRVRVVRADLFQDVVEANHQLGRRERTPSGECQQTCTNVLRRAVPPPDSAFVVHRLTRPAARSYARGPMVTCPACGKENSESALECKRCRAPMREQEAPAGDADSLGDVCRRCEAYNEPGVRVCTNCGLSLFGEDAAAPGDKTPPEAFTPPTRVPETLSEELRALAISDEEAEEAGLTLPRKGAALDKPPPAGPAASGRRPPPAPVSAGKGATSPGITLAAQKACVNCSALNPPAAKFCFDCGTPFAKKAAPAPAPPSIQVDAALGAEVYEDATMESPPLAAPEPLAGDLPVAAESVAEEIPEEQAPPFVARLVQEGGPAQGAEFTLAHLENSIGGSAAHIGFGDDAFVAPHAATLAFVDERLVLRDEGSANGVYLRVREPVALEPFDLFVAGERLLRYDG